MGLFLDLQFYSFGSYAYPVPQTLDYYYFIVVNFEIKKYESSDFILFQDYFGFLEFHYGFYDQLFNFYKKKQLGFW